MAGAQMTGGKRDIVITKKPIPNNPAYPPSGAKTKIQKQSEAQIKTVNLPAGRLKIGLRVKQTENVEQFALVGKNGQALVLSPVPPLESPPNAPAALDLAAALGVGADEKWVTYTANFDPKTHGKKLSTALVLNPFDCHPNGVRVLLVAGTFDGLSFANDHYIYGVSILPGQNSKGFPIDLTPTALATKPAGKAKEAPKRRRKR